MKKDKLDCILCSRSLFAQIVPSFQAQLDVLENIKGNPFFDEEDKNHVLILEDHPEILSIPFGEDWTEAHLPSEQLNYKIQGTITLRQLVNGIPIPIFLRNTEGVFIGCNPSFVDFMGMKEEDLVGKTVFQVVPQNEAEEYRQRDLELIAKPHIQIYEGKITDSNGDTKDVIFRKSLLHDDQDKAVAIVGVIVDISKRKKIEASLWEYRNKLEDMVLERTVNLATMNEQLVKEVERRKQSELALSESELLLRTIFNSTYDAILLIDESGHILDVNAKTMDLFNVTKDQIVKLNFIEDITSLENNIAELRKKWDIVRSGQEQLFEWNAKKPVENSCFEAEVFLRKIILPNRQLILANIRDITERKTVEKLLLQEHNKVKTALKHEMLLSTIATILNTTDNFFEVLDNLILIINNTLHLSGVYFYPFTESFEPALYGGWLTEKDQFSFDDHQTARYIFDQIQSNHPVYISSLADKTDKMKHFFMKRQIRAFSAMPMKISGKVSGMLTFQSESSMDWSTKYYSLFNTISNMLANSWERNLLLKQRLEVEKKNLETVQMLESSSRLASIGVMAAGITHEINQPLNAIKILADGVSFWHKRNPGILPEMFLSKMEKISQAVNRIDSIIKHMRSFWVNNSVSADHEFCIQEAIQNALELIHNQLMAHGVEIKLSLTADHQFLKGDMIHLEQIIINLCVNAMHALDKSDREVKKIIIHLYAEKDKRVLKIEDNGPGLPVEKDEVIFDPFYSTKKPGEGMGLGLAIVRQFVEGFNGSISAYNKTEESGAVFEIKI